MKKIADNPFDAFSADGTPLDFWQHVLSALSWIKPYLDDNNIQHTTFVGYCRSYASMIFDDPDQLTEATQQPDWELLVRRQQYISASFRIVREKIILTAALAQMQDHSKAQSERASKPRKLDEDQCKRIAKLYWESKHSDSGYGKVKELAREFKVSEKTIHNTAKKYKPT